MSGRPLRGAPDVAPDPGLELAADVAAGLGGLPRKLPSKYLYDEVGSALFEVICLLPEYGLTRADERLLTRHAAAIARHVPGTVSVAELGSGSGRKVRPLLETFAARGGLRYRPIDISDAALETCERELGRVSGVTFDGVHAQYLDGLASVVAERRAREKLLVLFVGSTIGNFERKDALEFLRDVRLALRPGDALLLGTDLEKPAAQLVAAYDDPTGVTAAFDLNLLARLNRELDATFDLRSFAHEARWNGEERRIEMHLRSLADQTVSVPGAGLDVDFRAGDTIWTESSYKFAPDEAARLGRRAGFEDVGAWTDREWPFAETLLRVP